MVHTILSINDNAISPPKTLEQIDDSMFLALSSGTLGVLMQLSTNIVLSGLAESKEMDNGDLMVSNSIWEQAISKFSKPLYELTGDFKHTSFYLSSIDNRMHLCAFTAFIKDSDGTYVSPYSLTDSSLDLQELNESVSEAFYAH